MFVFEEVSFDRNGKRILDHLSIHIKDGKKTAIVGSNGAGKSTLLLHLNGLFQQSEGRIYFRGQIMDKILRKQMVHHVSMVFQDPDDQIISHTVEEDIAFAPLQMGCTIEEAKNRVKRYAKRMEICPILKENPSQLSYGQKKQVTISGALAMETDVLLLDEPMAFLDPQGKERMLSILQLLDEQGKTVIAATHDMQFVAEWADEVIVIHEGRCLGQFTPSELFQKEEILQTAKLNIPVTVQLMKAIWKKEWGDIPSKINDCQKWLQAIFQKRDCS
jgi:cobalt/nickel transport system ATP-binding protein